MSALIEYINRVEELNRGLERAGEAHAGERYAQVQQEYNRNYAKATELMDKPFSGGKPLFDVARSALFRLDPTSENAAPTTRAPFRRWLNAAGLLVGIIGVVIVWHYGWPQPTFPRHVSLVTQQDLSAQADAAEAHYRHMATLGLVLIVAGFLLQFLNELLPRRDGA